jgi:hypothetical protein
LIANLKRGNELKGEQEKIRVKEEEGPNMGIN